ncbi:uncharacterized protein LOC131875979 [Cryptomeria japonica]|uniref:uncharacterized protein LOC131875979 n=1 Tax=Cryptomeria japonica TaxID=3369 RepID=UPI0027D9E5E0|nr:uncharacterized protein LOC131875979 [Cryptomeria japonica]
MGAAKAGPTSQRGGWASQTPAAGGSTQAAPLAGDAGSAVPLRPPWPLRPPQCACDRRGQRTDNNYEKGDKWKNTPYRENKNQYNYRQCNNHNGERRTNKGEIASNWNNRDWTNKVSNDGGNHGNNGNYGDDDNGNNQNGNNNNGNNGNNGGNGNYQTNNYGCKPPITIESKTHYEILSHKPNTLQKDFKTNTTIENNRKAAGKICKRDNPKLYNPTATKKDEFGQIMDMLKDMKDSSAAMNIMLEDVMKEHGMHVGTPYGKWAELRRSNGDHGRRGAQYREGGRRGQRLPLHSGRHRRPLCNA